MEDLHWVDPSTLELLNLLVDQGPTARILALLTFRPDFSPPWTGRSHLTQMTVNRLPRQQAVEVIRQMAHGKDLPPEVVEQIVARTDGVPLFVEELTKMVLESGLLQEREERYELAGPLPPLAIPATLHDSLMARLDRLATVKGLAQLGATLGREFSYALLQAVSPWDERTLQRGLQQLVEAEFLYQRGLPPQATYLFKHALIQEAAYQSLLRSTRQQYHQRIAQVLEARFPEVCETQPELLAHHYTEAGLAEQAVDYWLRAGQRASERSANQEAISHLTTGLALLRTLPSTPARTQQELLLQTTLGPALMAIKGQAAPEVEQAYARARELCQQLGETPQIFPVLQGLVRFYMVRGLLQTAREVGEQLLRLAQRGHDPAQLLATHQILAATLFWQGECALAHAHTEQGLALYDPQQHCGHPFLYGIDPGVNCLFYAAHSQWILGYPEQACQQYHAALTRTQDLAHAFTLVHALFHVSLGHQLRREGQAAQERAETVIALCTEQGSPLYVAWATTLRGWALTTQRQTAEGIAQMRQGLAATRATGAEGLVPYWLALLAEACGCVGQVDEGLHLLAEALAVADTNAEHWYEAELYRLKGELLLAQSPHQHTDAEACFQHALDIAGAQYAKAWELRAAMSLSRLWQQQGKCTEARALLAPIYDWFSEGFDTADLQEAKSLLAALMQE
jgi:predicted ATPase